MTTTYLDAMIALSDRDLCAALARSVSDECQATARLVAALAEMDRRRLYHGQGCASLFAYCSEVLHLNDGAAYTRIEAARSARQWPLILDLLAEGSITLTTVRLLAPHLSDENHVTLLGAATHKTKRDVELQVAALRPLAAVPSSIRKLPAPVNPAARRPKARASGNVRATMDTDHSTPRDEQHASPILPLTDEPVASPAAVPAPPKPAIVAPLSPERFRVQFTLSRESYDCLKQAQNLLRHVIPTGDPAAIFERALRVLLADLERKKLAATNRPRSSTVPPNPASRHIPASVRREVWKRDAARCTFVGSIGRCTQRAFLEFHHIVAFAHGGPTTTENLTLRCRAHNQYEAERLFGPIIARETAASAYLAITATRPRRSASNDSRPSGSPCDSRWTLARQPLRQEGASELPGEANSTRR